VAAPRARAVTDARGRPEPEAVATGAPAPWRAEWIWCRDPGIVRDVTFAAAPRVSADACDRRVMFRKTVILDHVPDSAMLRITADSRYTLWVNGQEMARGPARSQPHRLLYDVVDVAPMLQPGPNILSVGVRFYGYANAWWMPARTTVSHGAGVLLAELTLPGGVVGTDATWRCHISNAWQPQEPAAVGQYLPEILDGAELDPRWLAAEFDDTGWQAARVVAAIHLGGISRSQPPTLPYGPLLPRRIALPVPVSRPGRLVRLGHAVPPDPGLAPTPYLADASVRATHGVSDAAFPLQLCLDAAAVAVLTVDFGEIVCGTLVLDLIAPTGTLVDARLCEELDADGRMPKNHYPHGLRYRARGHSDRFESGDPAGGRYAIVVLRGSGHVTVREVAVRERLRPRPPGPYFQCSDPGLDKIYQTGLRTVDLTAQDAYLDCPTREQRAWTGDAVVHQSVDLLTNPDWRLARWHPELAASPRSDGMLPMAVACDLEHISEVDIPDWSLHWIRSVHNLYRWTGDRESVASLLPVAENVLRWFQRFVRDGLLTDVTGWVLLDWASVQGIGASAVLNGLWGRALLDFAEMAQWIGDNGRESWARGIHSALATAYQVFWDTQRGGYRDWLYEATLQPQLSEHASAAATVGGLVPANCRAAVLRFIGDRSALVRSARTFGRMPLGVAMAPLPAPDWDTQTQVVAAQPFFRYVVHDAVALLGGADRIPALCRDWLAFLDAGASTWPETWHGGSRCHGWSATPSRDLPLYTLGISPAVAGFARARIAPRLGDLAWARGAVPTPAGLVDVSVAEEVTVSSPVPFRLELDGQSHSRPPGRYQWPRLSGGEIS
jgi:alpha-L-rhamnosidase